MTDIQKDLLNKLSSILFGNALKNQISDELLSEARNQAISTIVTNDYEVIANNLRVTFWKETE